MCVRQNSVGPGKKKLENKQHVENHSALHYSGKVSLKVTKFFCLEFYFDGVSLGRMFVLGHHGLRIGRDMETAVALLQDSAVRTF